MSTMSIGGATLALVEYRYSGIDVAAYQNRKAMVLALLNNGLIGGEGGYGSEKHLAALSDIEDKIKEVRADIALHNEKTSHPTED